MEEAKTVHILGTTYRMEFHSSANDEYLKDSEGYTDKTSHLIVVAKKPKVCELDVYENHQRKVMRHEIIHAFMFESGLEASVNWTDETQEHPEMLVDWFAIQFPKMLEAFMEADAM